jgi:ribosomal protein S18 acetylase RimI-like enzyme
MSLGNPDRPVGGLAVPRPEGIEIRPPGRDDADAVLALADELHGTASAPTDDQRVAFEAIVSDVDAAPLLALAGTEPVGFMSFGFRRRLNHATFEGWLSEIYVREAHRRRGIGRALLGSAIAEWRLRGGHQVETELRREQVEAIALAVSAGFADQGKFYEIAPVAVRHIPRQAGVELRPIEDSDADFNAVTRLLAELGRPSPSEEQLPALRRTYAQHVGRPATGSMLATLDGQPVGFVSLELRIRLRDGLPEAWIPDLIVAEAARGRDIGAALLDAAFAAALERGATSAKLESGSRRAVAHRLYEAAGMLEVGSFLTLGRAAR